MSVALTFKIFSNFFAQSSFQKVTEISSKTAKKYWQCQKRYI